MSERRGTKGLELWCKKMTEGYPGVKVENMTTSWRDGLAFCAIIHHFRPDLIDFSKLSKEDIYHNNELAFRVAEHHLGIPALLEPEDMVEYSVPDRLSILTYLSQFYQAFAEPRGSSSSRIANKRPQATPDHDIGSPTSSSPPTKVASIGIGKLRREPCAKCGLPVFIAERLNIGKLHFHRTCFKCARCNSQLTLASYYETEKGEFCCEVCPDEEKTMLKASSEKLLLQRSMSDEEKTASLRMITNQPDDYSSMFETALENVDSKTDDFSQARSNFFSSQIASSDSGNEDEPPDLPNTEPPGLTKSDMNFDKVNSGFPDVIPVHSIKSSIEQPLNSSRDIVTKEQFVENTNISLVKARMRFFENDSKSDVSRNSQNSNQVPVIPIIKLDELENFNVSKKDINYTDDNKISSSVREESNVSTNVQNSDVEINKFQDSTNIKNDDNPEDSNKESVQYWQKFDKESPEKNVETKNDGETTSARNVTAIDAKIPEISTSDSPTKVSEKIDMLQKYMKNSTEKDVVKHEIDSSLPNDTVDHLNNQDLKIVGDDKETVVILNDGIPVEDLNKGITVTDTSTSEDEHSIVSHSIDESIKILSDSSIAEDDKSVKSTSLFTDDSVQILTDSVQILTDSYRTEDPSESVQIIEDTSKEEDENQAKAVLPVIEESCTENIMSSSASSNVILVGNQSDTQHEVLSPSDPSRELSLDIKLNSSNRQLDKDYPEDLNPFDDEPEKPAVRKSLNPFGSDDEDDDSVSPFQSTPQKPAPTPRMKRKIVPHPADRHLNTPLRIERISLNPFEDDEDDNEAGPPVPATRKKKVISAPKISLNPFWSDDEENNKESLESVKQPVPIPRGVVSRTSASTPEPRPRDHSSLANINRSLYGSTSSISSGSFQGSAKKKKPAPRPPIPNFIDDSAPSSLTASPSHSAMHSPYLTPKYRKNKRAPLPPGTSTPVESKLEKENGMDALKKTFMGETDIEKEKIVKDEQNRSKQNYDNSLLSPTSSENSSSLSAGLNKSTYGQWKRRKAQAPKRPVPQRRVTTCLPMSEIRRELDLIETQQQGLERQGVRLEQIIRDKCEGTPTATDEELPIDVEDLILQLFEIVNEKNELFRKQTELMYLKRQQRLEEEHADIEYQIRCLMLKPEDNKTDSDKAREEELIKRLVDIVERRNEIIECLEMDRVREAEEDSYINDHINLYTSKREVEKAEPEKPLKEKDKDKKKKHKKESKSKSKSKNKIDVDKDIDESEPHLNTEKKKKKKFNLF